MRLASFAPVTATLIVTATLLGCDTGTDTDADEIFSASLSGQSEVPAVTTAASGTAEFTHDVATGTLQYELQVANIANAAAAHIHLGAPGTNGPVIAFLFETNAPQTVTGSAVLETGTITSTDVIARDGFAGTFAALLAEIRAGNTYVNVHTLANPAGEIRGQIARAQ